MSRIIRICPGVGDRKCGAFLSSVDRDPHPTCTRCRGRVCTMDMTCDICAVWSVAQWEQFVKKRTYKERKRASRPSGSVPPAPLASPRAETSSGVSRPGTFSSSSSPLGGQGKQEGFQGAPVVVSGGLPPLPLDLGPARGVGVPLGSRLVRAPASPSPSGAGEVGAARSQQTPTSCASASVVSPQSLLHVQRREDSRETSESCPRVLSSRGSRSSDRGARRDRRARSRTSSSRGRRRRSRSLSSSRSRSRGRERRRWSSSRSLSSRARSRCYRSRSFDCYWSRRGSSRSRRDRSRSSDRYQSRRDRSRRERSRSVDHYRSRRQRTRSPARRGDRSDRSWSHVLPNCSRDRSRSRGRLPGSPARSRVEEPGQLARRETQEAVEAVASQPPAVSEAAVAVTSVAGGAALTTLPSAVQDLARFFLSLSGSSSLGAIGGIAGVTASAAGSWGAVCPPTDAGGAVTIATSAVAPAGAGVSPAAPATVPGVSGEQQRKVESRSRGRRSRSSSDWTDR